MVCMYLDLLDVFNVECIGKYTYRVAKTLLYNTHFFMSYQSSLSTGRVFRQNPASSQNNADKLYCDI